MHKQTLVVIIGALIVLGLGVFGAMAYTGESEDNRPTMRMPDGSTMPADQMPTTGGTHTMDDGATMDGESMP